MRPILLGLLAILASCRFQTVQDDAGTRIRCSSNAECPVGWRCVAPGEAGLCKPLSAEQPAPTLSQARVTPSAGRAGDRFEISFDVSGALLADGVEVTADFDLGRLQQRLELIERNADTYRYSYLAVGNEPEGIVRVQATLRGASGNDAVRLDVGSFVLDFHAPVPSTASVLLTPPQGCSVATRLGPLGRARVAFTLSEPAARPVSLRSSSPLLTFSQVDGGGGPLLFDALVVADAGAFEGPVEVFAVIADAVGNVFDGGLALEPQLVVDTVPPAPPDVSDGGHWVHWRVPNGSTLTDGGAAQWVVVQSGFLPPNHLVRVFDDALNLEVGQPAMPAAGSTVIPISLPDRRALRAQFIDEACNLSPQARIRDGVLVVRPGQQGVGAMETAGRPSDGLFALREPVAYRTDGQVEVSGRTLVERTRFSGPRLQRTRLAWDDGFGRVMLFGGNVPINGPSVDELWEWNGAGWRQLSQPASHPEARTEPFVAYDRRRAELAVFSGGGASRTMWLFDGASWRGVSPPSGVGWPRGGSRGAMVWDGEGLLVVSQPGEPQSWRWNGSSFEALPGLDAGYEEAVAAYDSNREVSVVFTRLTDGGTQTWEWDRTDFRLVNEGTGPRYFIGQLSYDEGRRATLYSDGNAIWQWNGAQWSTVAQLPVGCSTVNHAYDRVRDELVLLPQASGASAPRTCVLLPDAGFRLTTFPLEPPPLAQASMIDSPLHGGLILHGGLSDGDDAGLSSQTWLWRVDAGWSRLADAGPAVADSTLVALGDGGVLLLAGTPDAGPLGAWLLRSSTWTAVGSGLPPGRVRAVSNGAGAVAVVDDAGTWGLSGSSWTPLSSQPARVGAQLTSLGATPLLAGGSEASMSVSTMLLFDGGTWDVAPGGGTTTAAREEATLTFDGFRQIALLLGGVRVSTVGTRPGGAPIGVTLNRSVFSDSNVAVDDNDDGAFPRRQHVSAYSTARRATLIVGGRRVGDGVMLADSYWYDGARALPELVLRFDALAFLDVARASIGRVDVSGSFGGQATHEVDVFDEGRWQRLGSASGGFAMNLLQPKRTLFAIGNQLGFRIVPSAPPTPTARAAINLDDFEVRLTYRLE